MKMKVCVGLGVMVLGVHGQACGGDEKRPETASNPAPSSAPSSSSASNAATAAPVSSAPATPAASTTPPPTAAAAKGKFNTFSLAASSGKVDKVGNKDGAFTPDGVKDLVFDAEVEGPAVAIAIVSVDAAGQPNGTFSADTYVGDQTLPSEVGAGVKPGKATAGVAVYENDKLLNIKDGSLSALSEGKHKLVLHITSKDAPKGSFKAFAVYDNKTAAASPSANAN